jgi:hypothetical protein
MHHFRGRIATAEQRVFESRKALGGVRPVGLGQRAGIRERFVRSA